MRRSIGIREPVSSTRRNRCDEPDTIKIISPIDGSVYAERRGWPTSAPSARRSQRRARRRPRGPGAGRGARPMMLAVLDALLAMNDEVVPELAWQMGRPVRYGGEMRRRSRSARATWSASPRRRWRPIVPEPKRGLPPLHRARAARRGAGDRAVELSLSDRGQHRRAGADGRQRGDAQACRADAAGRRALRRRRSTRPACRRACSSNLVLDHDETPRLIAARHVDHVSFTGSVAGGRAIERAAAGTFTGARARARRQGPGLCAAPTPISTHAVENLVDGAFFNSGQCCCGIERIYVHERVYDGFVEGFVALTRKYVLGDPLDAGDHARPDGAASALPTPCASRSREAVAQGREGADRPEALPGRRRRRPIWRRRC